MWIEEHINKTGKKSYTFLERYLDPKTQKLKRTSITFANKSRATQKEAQNLLNDRIDEILNNKIITNSNLTFVELMNKWLPMYKQQVRETTYFATVANLKTLSTHIPQDTVISAISTVDLNNIFDDLLYKENLSNRYVSIIKSKCNLVFEYAKKLGYILDNPIDNVKIDYKRNSRPVKIKDKFLEDDEYKRIIDYTISHNLRYGLLFQFLYQTGLRIGEATALQKSDIFITDERDYVSITGTLLYKNRDITNFKKSDQPKTAAGVRKVDLSSQAVKLIEQILKLNPKGDFLFQTSTGTPIVPSAVNNYLRTHKVDFDVDKPLSSHIFRHTHISKLAELGVPLYVIQNRVGHESSKVTEKIYLHVTEKAKEKLTKDLELL